MVSYWLFFSDQNEVKINQWLVSERWDLSSVQTLATSCMNDKGNLNNYCENDKRWRWFTFILKKRFTLPHCSRLFFSFLYFFFEVLRKCCSQDVSWVFLATSDWTVAGCTWLLVQPYNHLEYQINVKNLKQAFIWWKACFGHFSGYFCF